MLGDAAGSLRIQEIAHNSLTLSSPAWEYTLLFLKGEKEKKNLLIMPNTFLLFKIHGIEIERVFIDLSQ